jgi:hypothetical protein
VVPVVLCVIAAVLIALTANDDSIRTLYPIGLDGAPDTTKAGTVGTLGIAVYVAGAGVAAALIGSLMLRQSKQLHTPDAVDTRTHQPSKKCPDCAETVLADAKVCKHCAYRFAPAAVGNQEAKQTSPAPQPLLQPTPKSHKTLGVKPRTNPPTSATALRLGDQVQLVAPGNDNDGKTGKVTQVLEDGQVVVRFGGLRQFLWEHPFRSSQLKRLDSPTK